MSLTLTHVTTLNWKDNMSAGDKIVAAMWMIKACCEEDMTHAEKNKILRVAYRMLREGIAAINGHVFGDKSDVPF